MHLHASRAALAIRVVVNQFADTMVPNIERDSILLLGIVFYMRNINLTGIKHQKNATRVIYGTLHALLTRVNAMPRRAFMECPRVSFGLTCPLCGDVPELCDHLAFIVSWHNFPAVTQAVAGTSLASQPHATAHDAKIVRHWRGTFIGVSRKTRKLHRERSQEENFM